MDFNGLLKTYVEEVLNKGIKRSARTDLSKIHKYLLPVLAIKIADMTEADIVAICMISISSLPPATAIWRSLKRCLPGYTHGIYQPLSGALYQSAA